jgi:hypothetical protein
MTDYAVDRDRWARMTIFEQMGNIYSEVGRSFNAKRQHREDDMKSALTRALDLFDATVEMLVSQQSPRTKEVLRARDQYLEALYDENPDSDDMRSLERYFLQYAIAARR